MGKTLLELLNNKNTGNITAQQGSGVPVPTKLARHFNPHHCRAYFADWYIRWTLSIWLFN